MLMPITAVSKPAAFCPNQDAPTASDHALAFLPASETTKNGGNAEAKTNASQTVSSSTVDRRT